MADVDAFPINKDLLNPILKNPMKKVWIYQYDNSLKHGATFAMSFTGMHSNTWKNILHDAKSTEDLIQIFGKNNGNLDFDQYH